MEKEVTEFITSSKHEDFRQVARVISSETWPACGANENFVGEVLRTRVRYETHDGAEASIGLVVKRRPRPDALFIAMYEELGVFNAEVRIYEDVLSGMEKLIKGNNKTWKRWPKYYGHSEADIFLEDLSVEGFTSYPKAKTLELKEASLVMTALGQMHGVSLSLVERGLFDPTVLPPNTFIRDIEALRKIERDACQGLAAAIEAQWDQEWHIFPEKIRKLGETIGQLGIKLWQETKGKYDVINHGDCWINNLLFKYNSQSKQLEDMKLVDFQACHYNSPAWDIMQVMYSGLEPRLRKDNQSDLLSTYLSALELSSRSTGYCGRIPSKADLEADLDVLAPCSLVRTFVTYPFFLNLALQETEMPENIEGSGYSLSLYSSQYIKDILGQTIKYFYQKNLF